MSKMEYIPVDSSMIKAITYNEQNKTLFVQFKNESVYAYSDVENTTVEQFLKAESKGKFFNANVKEQHTCTKI